MFAPLTDLVLLSVVAGTISVTLSHTKLTQPIRHRMIGWPLMLGELANCPYCIGHWVAFALSALVIGGNLLPMFLNGAVLTGGAALFSGILLRLLIFREAENETLRALLKEVYDARL